MRTPLFSETGPVVQPNGQIPCGTDCELKGSPSLQDGHYELVPRPRRINPYKLFVGSFIPNWLLRRREVSQGAKLCYARLAQYAGENGYCFPKQATVASELGVVERTARDYIRELEEFGLIESVQNGLQTSNDYYFLDHPWIFEVCSDAPTIPDHARHARTVQKRKSTAGLDRRKAAAPTSEENQLKEDQDNEVHTIRAPGIPCEEAKAVEAAKLVGVPEDFARTEFNRMEAVGWLDGCQRPVRSWSHYIKQRWAKEQSERAERKARSATRPGRHGGVVPPRTFDTANYNQPLENF